MAIPSNRSPSPLSSRGNPRNSESHSTIRRSFSGNCFPRPSVLANPKNFNPVTPANSPAGFGRRNSLGKEGMSHLQSCDEKENDKDHILKPGKVRSPANGSKNFMSPTISAASKFTPSPRKKPLVERNEPVRTSISLSDGKATFLSAISMENSEDLVPKSEPFAEQKKGEGCLESNVTKETVPQCVPTSKVTKKVTFADQHSDSLKASEFSSDTVTIDSDCSNTETSSQNNPSCLSVSPAIAPLDADPSIPPYDPKTNYLSPRPQFLHYKPNPRIELLLNNNEKGVDSEVKRLEESFILESSSGTFSDTDSTEESNSEDSSRDSEDSSHAETDEVEVKVEELPISELSVFSGNITPEISQQELHLPEEFDVSSPVSYEVPQNIVGRKRRLFTSLKFVSLLLVFLIGVIPISVTNSPAINSSVLKTLNFSELHLPPEVAVMAKANLHAFTGRFKQLSVGSISHLSMLIKNLGGHDKLSPQRFINLTDLQKDILVGSHLCISESLLPIGPTIHEAENAMGLKRSERSAGNFETENEEDDEDGEPLQVDEENYGGTVSDGLSEMDLEWEIYGGTQELTSSPAPVSQMEEPESLEIEWSQEEAASIADTEEEFKTNADDQIYPASETLEVKSEENALDIQSELLEIKKLEGSAGLGSRVPKFESSEDYIDPTSEGLEAKSEEKAPEMFDLLETNKLGGAIGLASGAKVEFSSAEDINQESNSDVATSSLEPGHSEMVEPPIGGSQNMLSAYYAAGVTSAVLVIISTAAHICLNRGATSKRNPVVLPDQLSKNTIPRTSILKQMHPEKPSSQNWPAEVEVTGESCPSEMSSFQTTSFLSSSRLKSADEAQSQERKPRKHSRRESLASSSEYSMGTSPSYGSFTTYEKIPNKHGSGDEEIMTPVRRSSRIRNLATSP